jgi:vitamin B12 transporter
LLEGWVLVTLNMMIQMKTVRIIILFLVSCSAVWTQTLNPDSTKTYQLGEVVVTATRSPISIKDSPSPVEVIDLQTIEHANGSTVADVLENYSSVFLKDYGADAALKTVSLRGTASEHLLVLVNGSRINSLQNGLVDFSLLPLTDVERIEIVHSGSSALYGADALGGVVNILTRRPSSDLHFRAELGGGSFGLQRYALETQVRVGKIGLLGGYSSERGRDDFPFYPQGNVTSGSEERRINSDFFRRQAYVHANVDLDEHSLLTFSTQHVVADRGTPGDLRFQSDLARQNDNDVNILASYLDTQVEHVEFSVRTAFHYNLETYDDPTFGINSFYKTVFLNVNPQARARISAYQSLILGGELGQGVLFGNDFDGRVSRVQRSAYASNEFRFEFERPFLDRISLYQTLRYDNISDVDDALTPKIGVNVRALKEGDLRLRSSFGWNFRAPSFNDMYYRGFSNPNLKPERSTSFDVGLLTTLQSWGEHTFELTYFHLRTKDRILFDPTAYLPVNIGEATSTGLEGRYQGDFLEKMIGLTLSYTLADARKANRDSDTDPSYDKQLPYVPSNVATLNLTFRFEPVVLSVTHSFVGRRYTTADNSKWLSPYHLTNANGVVTIPMSSRKLFAKAEVNNIFDKDYEVFQYYPMPGRNFRFTLGLEY